jgi:hypothetical protein
MTLTCDTKFSNKVAIPATFFLEEAKKEYYRITERLVAELLQNSIDAGSKEISIVFDDDYYSYEDNGCGMDLNTLTNGMLTMGGSIKGTNATGGFGAAKKLILFSHKSYELITNNIMVNGAVLEYNIVEQEQNILNGTYIKCFYSDPDLFCKEDMVDAAHKVLSQCFFDENIKIHINGRRFTNFRTVRGSKTRASFGDVYAYVDKQKTEKHSYITVLHNGIFMFSSYVGFSSNMEIVINVDIPSKKAFSQNRTSFINEYDLEFNEIKTKLLSNKKALVTNLMDEFSILGLSDFSYTGNKTKRRELSAAFFNESSNTSIDRIREMKKTLDTIVDLENNNPGILKNNAVFKHTIHYIIPNSLDEKEKNKLLPGSWIEKYRFVLSLWNTILTEIARIRQDNIVYGVGFVVEKDVGAKLVISNMPIFYINPYIFKTIDNMKEKFYTILMAAIHEYCHYILKSSSHDEDFTTTFTYLTSTILTNLGGVVQLTKQARETII